MPANAARDKGGRTAGRNLRTSSWRRPCSLRGKDKWASGAMRPRLLRA